MDNGCVCCTVRGDLVKAFKELASREEQFDGVIIETTGLADPGPVCFTFQSDPVVRAHFRIDSILCLVDAKHVSQHLEEEKPDDAVNEAVHQVAFADKILLNKIDLVSEEELEEVEMTLHSINGYAQVFKTQNARVDLSKLLGLGSFMLERVAEMMDSEDEEDDECTDASCTLDHDHGHGHEHAHGDSCTDAGCSDKSHDHDHGHGHGHEHGHGDGDGDGCTDKSCDDKSHDHDHGHGHGHEHDKKPEKKKKKKKRHDLSRVGSVGLQQEGELDMKKFQKFMGDLLSVRCHTAAIEQFYILIRQLSFYCTDSIA